MPKKRPTEPFGFNKDGKGVCFAKLKGGGRCQQTRINPRTFRCRMHNGQAQSGAAASNFKTGRYSQDLPTRLLSRYEDLMTDDTLLSLRNDIALLGASIGDELAEIKKAEAEPDIEAFIGMAEKIATDWKTWDWTRMDREMSQLIEVAKGRRDRQQAMFNVRGLIRDKAALVAQENKLLEQRESMIPLDQVIILMRAIAGIVRREVRDPDTLRIIEGEFTRVMTTADQKRAV